MWNAPFNVAWLNFEKTRLASSASKSQLSYVNIERRVSLYDACGCLGIRVPAYDVCRADCKQTFFIGMGNLVVFKSNLRRMHEHKQKQRGVMLSLEAAPHLGCSSASMRPGGSANSCISVIETGSAEDVASPQNSLVRPSALTPASVSGGI